MRWKITGNHLLVYDRATFFTWVEISKNVVSQDAKILILPLKSLKVTVWCVITKSSGIGPYFFRWERHTPRNGSRTFLEGTLRLFQTLETKSKFWSCSCFNLFRLQQFLWITSFWVDTFFWWFDLYRMFAAHEIHSFLLLAARQKPLLRLRMSEKAVIKILLSRYEY